MVTKARLWSRALPTWQARGSVPSTLPWLSACCITCRPTTASALLKALPGLLKPDGRFLAAEPVFHPEQRTTARVLAALDRGRFVRDQLGYEGLVAPWFKDVTSEVRHDLYWFPYSHCVVQASAPA